MGKTYKTAQGKILDIDSLRLVNETTVAVGNMKVNARGDQLGPGGQIIKTRNQVMDQHYSKLHTPVIGGAQQQQAEQAAVASTPDVDPSGVPFDPPVEDTAEPAPQLRGSLADSIAKQVTVKQEKMDPNMYKPKGPQRI